MLPMPTTPSVFPASSRPWKRFFSHLPAFTLAVAAGTWRESESIMRERELGDGDRRAAGRVHHHDAAAGGGVEVHVVDADAGAADHLAAAPPSRGASPSPWWRCGPRARRSRR